MHLELEPVNCLWKNEKIQYPTCGFIGMMIPPVQAIIYILIIIIT